MSQKMDLSHSINTIQELGALVRQCRKEQGLSQTEFAGVCGVGNRFISDLESGKPTMRLDKVLQVLQSLGLALNLVQRAWKRR